MYVCVECIYTNFVHTYKHTHTSHTHVYGNTCAVEGPAEPGDCGAVTPCTLYKHANTRTHRRNPGALGSNP